MSIKNLKPPSIGDRIVDISIPSAIRFSNNHIAASDYDNHEIRPKPWLNSGASLLRAAKSILRQIKIDAQAHDIVSKDFDRIVNQTPLNEEPDFSGMIRCSNHTDIGNQMVFLAALAVENSLKGVIAGRVLMKSGNVKSGFLP